MNSGRIAFKHARHTIRCLVLVVVCSLSLKVGFAQTDSTFSVSRNGVEAKFPFTKFSKPEQLRTVANAALPLYSFNKPQFARIKGLLIHFAQMENEYRLWVANYREKDSISVIKEKALIETAKLEQERANNFQASYQSLLNVNAQLNDQVKNAEQLAVREHRKRKFNSILIGVLALSAGVVIGVTVR